jgi:hypothetical protein
VDDQDLDGHRGRVTTGAAGIGGGGDVGARDRVARGGHYLRSRVNDRAVGGVLGDDDVVRAAGYIRAGATDDAERQDQPGREA